MECFKPWGLKRVEWVMIDRNDKPSITSEGVWVDMIRNND
jgi:hypothetical protein